MGLPFESSDSVDLFQAAKYMSRGCRMDCNHPHSRPLPGWGLSFTFRVTISPSSLARLLNVSSMDFSFVLRVFASQSPIQLSALSASYILWSQTAQSGISMSLRNAATLFISPLFAVARTSCRSCRSPSVEFEYLEAVT